MMTHAAYLEASDPARNIYRAYCIDYGQDLFHNWIVEVTYGHIGSKGRTLIVVVKDEEQQALKEVQKFLQRRQSAMKRIGISYKARKAFETDE